MHIKQTVPHDQLEETSPAYQTYARNVLTKKEKTDKKIIYSNGKCKLRKDKNPF